MPLIPGDQSSEQTESFAPTAFPNPQPNESTPKPPEMAPHPNGRAPTNNIEAYAESVLNRPPKPKRDPEAELEAFANEALKPIEDNEEQDKLLAASLEQSFNKDPKKAARVLELEKFTGLPGDFIERNQDDVEKEVRGGSFNAPEFRAKSPKLSKWMSENQNNAGAIRNDVNWFESLEGGTRKQSVSKDIWDAVGSGLAGLNSSIAKAPSYLADLAYAPQNILADKLDLPGLKYNPPKSLGNNKVTKYFDDAAKNLAPALSSASISDEIQKGVNSGDFNRAAETLVIQFAQNFPNQAALLLSAVSGYGAAGLVGAGLTSASTKHAENKEKGLDPSISAIGATATGAVEAGFEHLGTFGILSKWEKAIASKYGKGAAKQVFRDFGKTMTAAAGGEFNEEFWTSIVQDSIDMSIGADQSPLNLDTAGKMGRRALDAGILGGASGGLMTGPAATLSGYARVNSDANAQAQIKYQQDFLQTLEAGAGSELYKNSPEVMQDAVNEVTKGTPMAQVRIEAEAWRQYWQSKGEDPKAKAAELMGDDGSSYDVALESGHDLNIPTGAYAAKIVGTEHSAELNQDVKLGDNGRSPRQIQADVKKADAEAKEILSKHDEEFDVIKGDFERKLRLATPDDSETNIKQKADAAARMIRTAAEKSKKSMDYIYKHRAFDVFSETTGVRVGSDSDAQFTQGNPEWLDENKRRDAKFEGNPESVQVTDLNVGTPRGFTPKQILKDVRSKLIGQTATNQATGWEVEIPKAGLLETASKNRGKLNEVLRSAIENLPTLIERAIYDRVKLKEDITDPNDTNVNAEHWLYAPVQVGDKTHLVSIHIKEIQHKGSGQKKFYFERVSEEGRPVSSSRSYSPEGAQSVGTSGPAPLSIDEVKAMLKTERKSFPLFQTDAQEGRNLSPLGFYSQVEDIISKMDFKNVPAKDLAGRIANVQGIKKDELEHLGLIDWLNSQDGKVSKEDVLDYVREKTIKVEQIVLAKDFSNPKGAKMERDASNLPTPDELSWDEGTLDEPDSDYISDSAYEMVKGDLRDYQSRKWVYEMAHNDPVKIKKLEDGGYYATLYSEKEKEVYDELKEEFTNDDGEVRDEIWNDVRDEMRSWVDNDLQSQAYDSEYESYMENDGHGGGSFTYTESETGWTIQGSYDSGHWYSNDTNKSYSGNFEEAKIQLLEDMVDEGVVSYGIEEDASDVPALPSPEGVTQDTNAPTGSSKWHRYMVPGGTNYREVLLTLPQLGPDKFKYTTHFNEENFVAHARMTDRTDLEGKKILFIEEIQSDWHQQGRERGYKTENPEIKALKAERNSFENRMNTFESEREGRDWTPEEQSEFDRLHASWKDTQDRLVVANNTEVEVNRSAVPDAPFKNTEAWSALVLKRMIRMATEQGYDGVSWSPSNIHVERWGTDSVSWTKVSKEGGLEIVDANGRIFMGPSYIESQEDADQIMKRAPLVENEYNQIHEEVENTDNPSDAQLEKRRQLSLELKRLGLYDTAADIKTLQTRVAEPYWMVGSVEQVGGTADGQNIEEQARQRGHLLEKRGERVTNIEDLRKIVSSTLNRERSQRSLDSITETVWKQMQDNPEGIKRPRKEGMEFFYDNMLPKKAAPAVLKGLDKKAKVGVSEISVSAKDGSERSLLEALGVKEGETSMKVWSIPLTQEMRENAMRGMTLFQNAPAGAKGMMNVSPSGRIAINIFKKADLSTWYHEMSHAFLEIMHDLQNEEGADQAVKAEFQVATEWFAARDQGKVIAEVKGAAAAALAASQDDPSNENLQGQAVAAREALRLIEEGGEDFMREVGRTFGKNIEDAEVRHILITPFHEQFARGFELYLREGVAPSNELKKLFRKMKKFLMDKFEQLSRYGVELSPEIRGFYDRMLATEQEISEAENQSGMTPMIVKPSEVLSESDALMYSEATEEMKADSRERMDARLMKDFLKERTEWWNSERERVREDVADQINKQKEYVALAFLGLGVQSDGSALPKDMMPVKISKASIVEQFGKDRLKALPRPYIYTAEGGVDVDEAAAFFDYGSGDEMLSAFESAEDKDSLIDRITDEQMKDQHGDKKLTEALPQEALDAIHSEKQAELLRMEMKFLAENKLGVLQKAIRQIGRGVPTVAQVREQAEAQIAGKRVRDIKPIDYSRAEKRAAKAAIEAVSRGDLVKAFEEKRKQLLNHELYRAARNAREVSEKYADYAHGLNKPAAQQRIGKAQGEYLDQINNILDRFNFNTSTSVTRGDRMKGLATWLKEQAENGVFIDVSDKLLDEAYRTHWKEMTFGELKDVRDTLKQIEHLAKIKNKLLADKKAREFAEVKGAMISSIEAHHSTVVDPEDIHPSLKDKIIEGFETARAKHTRIEVLSEFLDGNKAGGSVWENLFRPFARAQSRKTEMQHASTKVMESVLSAYTPEERAKIAVDKTFIPDFGDSPILKPNFTKADMLVVALNWGNEGNRQALMEGYGWSEDQVMKILSRLDSRDWQVVQGIWDHIDSFWADIAAQEKLLTGLVPEKVSAAPFVVRGQAGGVHEVKGGYYPLKFDPRFSEKTNQNTGKEMVQDLFGGGFIRAATRHGHTNERVGSRGQKIMLDLGVLANHINTVIHDLTHRVAVMDAMKLLDDKEVFGTISAAVGRPMAQQFKPWLASVSGARTLNPDEHYSKVFSWIKTNSTMVFLGFKLTSALVQGVDAFVAANEIGSKWMLRGFREAYLKNKISDSWSFATTRSEHMRNLIEHKQREIRELLQHEGLLEGKTKMDEFKELAMKPAHLADSAIALAIWTGSYHKAVEGHIENIQKGDEVAAAEYADRTVRTTQMAGDPKDESSIQRGTPLWKLFTQFYTPMNVAFNQMQKHLVMEQQLNGFQVGQFMHSVMMLVILPVIYELGVRGKMGEGDEDDENSWIKNIVGHTLMYPFEHVIGLRDLVKLFSSNEMGRSHFSPSPAYSVFESLADTYKAGTAAIDKGELDRKTVKAITMSAGYMGGLPVRQFWMTGEYTYDWMTGEEAPSTPAEGAWRALVIGKPRKK